MMYCCIRIVDLIANDTEGFTVTTPHRSIYVALSSCRNRVEMRKVDVKMRLFFDMVIVNSIDVTLQNFMLWLF